MTKLFAFSGLFLWILVAFTLSTDRKKISWPLVIKGLVLQLFLALCVLGVPAWGISGPLQFIFDYANTAIVATLDYTLEGSRFIFGDLVNEKKFGFIFCFQVLPTIIFVSTLMSLLYQLGIMQKVVSFFTWIFFKILKTSGAETLAASVNIFVGQTEAPLIVKPYLAKMTRSELLAIMVGGMANVAGGVLAAYVGLLKDRIPDIAGHLLTASVISAPASLVLAKILIPETETPETLGHIPDDYKKPQYGNSIEAATAGASEGLSLALNVAAQLLAFIALIALINGVFALIAQWFGFDGFTLQKILGLIFAPFTVFLGVPWNEIQIAGSLIGEKTILNEFVAYLSLTNQAAELSDRTVVIMSYALCGFANFSSIAIQVGGIGAMIPERKSELAKLGFRALIGGTLASFMTACYAGLLM